MTRLDDAEKRNAALHTYIENELPNRQEIETRDSKLLEGLSQSMERRRKEVKKRRKKNWKSEG